MNSLGRLMQDVAARCPFHRLPNDYLVLDVETSGFYWNPPSGKKADVIVQVGYAVVRDRQMTVNGAHYVKRPAGTMEGEAKEVTGITDEILAEKGEDPQEFYRRLLPLMELFKNSHAMFVGHNILGFDAPFIEADLDRQGLEFSFTPNEVIDTGCLYKAANVGMLPGPGEALDPFFRRVRSLRCPLKWRLEFTITQLGIDKEHNLDLEQAHDAAFDCRLTHLLFEQLRKNSERMNAY